MSLNYYHISRLASKDISHHSGLLYLKWLCHSSQKVLDVGCGEGTRLHTLLPAGKMGFGIDPNAKAIQTAQRQYPQLKFKTGIGEKIPYNSATFDLVYSAFSIEHCLNPETFISEMIRVLTPSGHLVILAPNYGAPNRRSPVSLEIPLNKLSQGIIKDFFPQPNLDWQSVTPRRKYNQIDDDTTFEPYLLSLSRYLQSKKLIIDQKSSLWSLEPKTTSPRKLIIKLLGNWNIFPFSDWGPQIFISAIK